MDPLREKMVSALRVAERALNPEKNSGLLPAPSSVLKQIQEAIAAADATTVAESNITNPVPVVPLTPEFQELASKVLEVLPLRSTGKG